MHYEWVDFFLMRSRTTSGRLKLIAVVERSERRLKNLAVTARSIAELAVQDI